MPATVANCLWVYKSVLNRRPGGFHAFDGLNTDLQACIKSSGKCQFLSHLAQFWRANGSKKICGELLVVLAAERDRCGQSGVPLTTSQGETEKEGGAAP